MLQKLNIKNAVLISEAEIDFFKGLNVLSGETGAGKSIVVDCLMLLFGSRYDKSLLRFGTDSGFVEGIFLLEEKHRQMLDDMGIASDEIAIIKRRFTSDGKSDVKINGQTVTLSMLRRLMEALIDIYGQHDFQQLASPASQLAILDYYDRHKQHEIMLKLDELYEKFKNCLFSLNDLGDAESRFKEIDFIKYQLLEIENSNTFKDEETQIIEKRKRALNIEKIRSSLSSASEYIEQSNIDKALVLISKLEMFDNDFSEFSNRLNSVVIELDDLNALIKDKLSDAFNENIDIDSYEGRLAFLRSLNKKYGDYDKMTEYYKEASIRLDKLENADKSYEELFRKKTEYIKELYSLSIELSNCRKAAAKELCKKLEEELRQLGMESATLSVVFNQLPKPEDCERRLSKNGFDQIEFYFSANVGQPLLPLTKTISGGEMSRFMLALKTITGNSEKIPTLIFDEIDAGISGRMGQEVAKKLAKISANSQILCVTHLPQIAAMADNHLCVSKQILNEESVTHVKRLDAEGMIEEISRLSGGVEISLTSKQSAAEIKSWSNKYKESLNNKYSD